MLTSPSLSLSFQHAPAPSGSRAGKARAFSLLEVLLAVSVLSLIILILAQIVNGAMRTTSISRKRIDADSEVRRMFDRMAFDFGAMLNRPDADFRIVKTSGNDEMYFFSETPARVDSTASDDPQPVSLVGYRINTAHQSERFGQGLTWDAAPPNGPVFITYEMKPETETGTETPEHVYQYPASKLETAYATALADLNKYHVLGEGVFRMEIDFLLKPTKEFPGKYSSAPYREDTAGPFTNRGHGLSQVQAIIVTLAVLDTGSRNSVVDMDMSGLAGKFTDTVEGSTPGPTWQELALNATALGLPLEAAGQVRIYQRVFPIN